MNKLIFILFTVFLFQNVYSQTFTEKKLADFPGMGKLDLYSFKVEPKTGAYVYGYFDTTANKFTIYTNKGKSSPYDNFVSWQTLFDDNGNSYSITYNNITDTTYTYFFLKNSESVATYDNISDGWVENNGTIYFSCKENNKSCIISYNTADGKITRGKQYDEIIPCYIKSRGGYEGEGEPVGELAFTKDGKIYYLASSGDEKFLVIGDTEQKHYSDIDMFNLTQDKSGTFTYIARDKGKFYEYAGNTFVVQGDKEYKKYAYIYGPIIFDANNTPVYTAADSGNNVYPARLVIGDKEQKTFDGGIYEIGFTPMGKIAYIASTVKNQDKGTYENFVVIDGKEGKKYSNLYSLSFTPGDEPYYTAFKGENECFIIKGNRTEEYNYPSVMELKIHPSGNTSFIGIIYGDYNKKIKDKYFVHINDEEFGPFDGISISDYTNNSYVQADNAGNYAFITQSIKNWKEYTYNYSVVTNKNESDEHEYIENLTLYKGKPLYTAYDNYDYKTGKSKYKVYYNNKPVGATYDGISDFKFDINSGTGAFYTSRDNGFYLVNIKF